MLPLTGDTLRLFVHVVAAVAWVGGTLLSMWLGPKARQGGSDAWEEVADAVRGAAWMGFAVLWVTGILNFVTVGSAVESSSYGGSLLAKLALASAGGAAFWAVPYARPRASKWLASAAALGAIGALLVGVQLGGAR